MPTQFLESGRRKTEPGALSSSTVDGFSESLIETLPDGCVVIDESGTLLFANQAWKDLPRQADAAAISQDPIGINYLELYRFSLPSERLERAVQGIKSVLSGELEQFEHEYIRLTPHKLYWFRMTVRPWTYQSARAVIFHRDITAEKIGHSAGNTVEADFRSMADAAPVLIWMSEPEKGCTFLNSKWAEFTGLPLEELFGARGWLNCIHPDDQTPLLEAYAVAVQEKRAFEADYRLLHRTGDYRYVNQHASPRLDSRNEVIGFIGTVWDLTEQKRAAEEAYRATRYAHLVRDVAMAANSAVTMREALQQSVDVICETMAFPVGHALLIDDDEPDMAKSSHIVYVKDMVRFRKLFEISNSMSWPSAKGTPGEVMRSGKPAIHDIWEDAKTPELYPRAEVSIEAGLRTGLLFPILVDEKVEAILEFASEELLVSDDDLIGTLTAASERLSRFFERRRAQIKFLKQKEELQTSANRLFSMAGRLVDSQEEERRRIAREIHDDFTQRLALVSMKIGHLAGKDRSSTPAEFDAGLEDIRNATATVANDLRDLSRQLHPAMLELLGFKRAAEALCEDFQRARGIETTFEATIFEEDASLQVATCLYRVLQESLMNIGRHSDSPRAFVSISRVGNEVEMRVRDDGKGFSTESESNRGIGLLNMEERVQLLQGTFTLISRAGSGHRDRSSCSGRSCFLNADVGRRRGGFAHSIQGRECFLVLQPEDFALPPAQGRSFWRRGPERCLCQYPVQTTYKSRAQKLLAVQDDSTALMNSSLEVKNQGFGEVTLPNPLIQFSRTDWKLQPIVVTTRFLARRAFFLVIETDRSAQKPRPTNMF